jgi:hypothetical protein
MGYNARNDEIHENLERMRREREACEDSLAIVRQFNARPSAKKAAWFWPTIAAALASKHHWLVIACDACDTVIDLDLTVKRRDPTRRSAWLSTMLGARVAMAMAGRGSSGCRGIRRSKARTLTWRFSSRFKRI